MIINAEYNYDNPYWADTVMGHAVSLLEQYRDKKRMPGLHIDLGCGYGRMAEDLVARTGATYVGIDGHPSGLTSLKERGFETHQLTFDNSQEMLAAIEVIIGERSVTSVSMLDTLEHLPNGDDVLGVIRTILANHQAHAVLSVPNFSHRDVGFKLAFGRIDYTEKGLLDYSHCKWFSDNAMRRTLQAEGLQIVASNPVFTNKSDQCFPSNHPALGSGSNLHFLLSHYRERCDDAATIGQFVHLVTAGPRSLERSYLLPQETAMPKRFLSIVMRTQGTRITCLEEALNALAAQDDRSFEVLVLGHKMSLERQLAVERVIADCVEWLRDRIRLIKVDDGNRTRPLNVGFAHAKGEYIAILDDDDMPFANWVSTFHRLATEKPGTVLRSISALQDTTFAEVGGVKAIRSVSSYKPYMQHFNFFHHLRLNESPPVGLAFPASLFHDMNITFDETLTTTEDWDYLMHCAVLVGVHNNPGITSVYRFWTLKDQSSRTDHDQDEWVKNRAIILEKFDRLPIVLPPGSASKISNATVVWANEFSDDARCVLIEISRILTSRSWRWTKFLRLPKIRRGYVEPTLAASIKMSRPQLDQLLDHLRTSKSWRKTHIFRKKK